MRYILRNYIQDAAHSIWSNKLRSFLSILGIVIGIVSVVVFLGIGKGAEMEMKQYLDKYSTKSLNLYPKRDYKQGGVPKGIIDNDIVQYLESRLHGVKAMFPDSSRGASISYAGDKSTHGTVVAMYPKYFEVFDDQKILYGRTFTTTDYEKKKKVGILTYRLAKDLFKGESALGKYIKVKDDVFMVVGVLDASKEEKENPRRGQKKVLVPTTIFQELFLGKTSYNELTIYAHDETNMEVLEYELLYLLMAKTGKTQKSELGFETMDASKFQKEQEEFATKAKLILMGIGAISLLVGGIGVMNIMLVSVTERTREIGIRKAIGARRFHIIGQFITESIFISIIGGIFAVALSYGIIQLLKKNEVPAVMTGDVLMLACLFSVGVGVIFGLLPALRAAKLKPIDALRFE